MEKGETEAKRMEGADKKARYEAETETLKTKAALQKRVTFEFVDAPLGDALVFLQNMTAANFVLIDMDGEKKRAPINLKVTDMDCSLALDWICRLADVKWEIRKGAVCVYAPEDWERQADKALKERVTLNFVNAEVGFVLDRMNKLTGAILAIDPAVRAATKRVTIHAENLPLAEVLSQVCAATGLKWEPTKGGARVLAPPETLKRWEATALERERALLSQKLRVKLANGNEIEIDGAIMARLPHLAEEVLDRALDRARDGILIYRLPEGPPGPDEKLRELIAQAAPQTKVTLTEEPRLLLIQGEETALRRAAALMRALGLGQPPERPEGPMPPPPPNADAPPPEADAPPPPAAVHKKAREKALKEPPQPQPAPEKNMPGGPEDF